MLRASTRTVALDIAPRPAQPRAADEPVVYRVACAYGPRRTRKLFHSLPVVLEPYALRPFRLVREG